MTCMTCHLTNVKCQMTILIASREGLKDLSQPVTSKLSCLHICYSTVLYYGNDRHIKLAQLQHILPITKGCGSMFVVIFKIAHWISLNVSVEAISECSCENRCLESAVLQTLSEMTDQSFYRDSWGYKNLTLCQPGNGSCPIRTERGQSNSLLPSQSHPFPCLTLESWWCSARARRILELYCLPGLQISFIKGHLFLHL